MLLYIKRWLFNFVVGDIFKGITEYDYVDLDILDAGERREYLWNAQELWKNPVLQTELLRLQHQEERTLIKKSKSDFDILIGKGQLLLLDLLLKRFKYLNDLCNKEKFSNDQSS